MYSTGLQFPDAIHTFLELKSSEMSYNIKVIEHSSCNSLDLIFPVVRGTFRSASKIGVEWANFFLKEPDNKYFRICESYRFNSHKSSHGQYENERTELCAYKNRQRARSGPQAMVCQPLQTPYQHLNHAIKLNTDGSFSLVGNFFKQPCDFSPASSNFSKLELRLSQVFIVDDQKLCVE